MKHTYSVAVQDCAGKWHTVVEDESRGYCEGFVDALADAPGPRLRYEARRDDGFVVSVSSAKSDVSIGQIAGHPTAEQYQRAGNDACERARLIRERCGL